MSFWGDLIIGEGQKQCSAILVFEIEGDHSISRNSTCYWISDLYLDTGMTIFRNTNEGRQLTQMINDKVGLVVINDWLTELILTRMPPKQLKEKIEAQLEKEFERGSKERASVIREALGLHR